MALAMHGPSGAPDTALVGRITDFLRLLRLNGFAIGLTETNDVLRLAEAGYLAREADFKGGLRGLLCSCRRDWLRFDEIFTAFWRRGRQSAVFELRALTAKDAPPLPRKAEPGVVEPPAADMHRRFGPDRGVATETGLRAAAGESAARVDLRHITDPELWARVDDLAERLAKRIKYRLSRRYRARRKGRRLDLRNTIHRAIRYGGTPIDLRYRKRHLKPLRVIMLLDASGSMRQYSAFFVRFIRGILDHLSLAEAFIFHTRLVHMTPALRERDPQKALERMALLGQGWGGGTKIAASLAAFNDQYAKDMIHARTVVIIVSDGYDTGEPDDLGREMARLKMRAKHVIWLNPMIGWPGYQPTAGGMAAAMPHIDLFAPAHNLESLAALEGHLARL